MGKEEAGDGTHAGPVLTESLLGYAFPEPHQATSLVFALTQCG